MRTNTTIPISEARKRIFDISNEVQKPGVYYTFTEKGRPKAILMSVEEFESWAETLEVMSEFPNLKKDIKVSEAEYKRGEYVTLEELLKKEGYVLADKAKKKYEVQPGNTKKSTKGNRKIRK